MMLRAVLIALVCAAPVSGQVVSPGLEHANPEMTAAARADVLARVEEFLNHLGNRDLSGASELLAPRALVVAARTSNDGTVATTYFTRDEFLAELEKSRSQPKFEERIANAVVTIEGSHLAHVRADFLIRTSGRTASSGVDHFTLVKEKGGWKVAVIAYTSAPAEP